MKQKMNMAATVQMSSSLTILLFLLLLMMMMMTFTDAFSGDIYSNLDEHGILKVSHHR